MPPFAQLHRRLVFFVACAVTGASGLLSGCHGPRVVERPGPAPQADELLQALRTHQQRVPTLDARVRATSWLSGERLRATVALLADRRGHLRFEAEVSLQGTVAILTTHDGEFASLDLPKSLLQRGPACPANVASLVKIPLSPEEVGAILMGDVALPAIEATSASVSWDEAHGFDRLTLAGKEGEALVLSFEPDANRWLRAAEAHDRRGKPVWRTAYDDFQNVTPTDGRGAISLPGLIRFAEGSQSFDDGVDMKFKERRVGTTLADDVFTLKEPPGVKTVLVGCGEAPPP